MKATTPKEVILADTITQNQELLLALLARESDERVRALLMDQLTRNSIAIAV